MVYVIGVTLLVGFLIIAGFAAALSLFYRKVEQGSALIRNGIGKTKVSFTGMYIIPILHVAEHIDISVKRIEIDRMGENGLICKDNMRADVKVAFFVRVNKTVEDVMRVAECLGCKRASDPRALIEFFDAKFSEALKTVGKQFDFVELYTNRLAFKDRIMEVIGRDLNGYILDDAAIDYLEQTPIDKLDPRNILDAEGIKKITDLTAQQAVLSNNINREKEKTIKKQDVEAREVVLNLERDQAEAEEKQRREIAEIQSRQQAEAAKVREEERLKAERARIASDEEIAVAEENRERQIIVAKRSKERTDAVELERIEKDRLLEATERERVVHLAQIERDKAIELEKKKIQDVIRERVAVERTVVEEQQKIMDTEAFATAERSRKVAVTKAAEEADQAKVKETTAAEAAKEAARHQAEQVVIEAEAQRASAEKEGAARKIIADAKAQEEAVLGVGEARALEAKAKAAEQYGAAEAVVIEKKARAEAQGIEARAAAVKKQGEAEAAVMGQKYHAEAEGIREKAEAMKLFDGVGREHEEFKLKLEQDLKVKLAGIDMQRDVVRDQAAILGKALEHAKIDIVGGDGEFFNQITSAITSGKRVDRWVQSSDVLSDAKLALLGGDGHEAGELATRLKAFVSQFGLKSEDLKNLTVSALMAKLFKLAGDQETKHQIQKFAASVQDMGLADQKIGGLL